MSFANKYLRKRVVALAELVAFLRVHEAPVAISDQKLMLVFGSLPIIAISCEFCDSQAVLICRPVSKSYNLGTARDPFQHADARGSYPRHLGCLFVERWICDVSRPHASTSDMTLC